MKNHNFKLLALCLSLFLIVSCGSRNKNLIGRYGLKYISIGDPLPPAGTKSFKGHMVYDSLIDEGDYTWRTSCIEYKKGVVYLEEDFFGSELLARIRISTPELHLKNGIHVGESLGKLVSTSAEWFIVPIPEYGFFDFYSRLYPRVHFLIKDPSVRMEGKDFNDFEPSMFNPDVLIKWIVVF